MAKKKKQKRFAQKTIALVYDFDGTLTPQPMQDCTLLKVLNISPEAFWKEVRKENKKTNGDEILTYLRLLIKKANSAEVPLKPTDLKRLGGSIKYFPGVETWFRRINSYVKKVSRGKVKVKHYIISAGMKEILNGIRIRKWFERIYGCEYFFDQDERPTFPKVVINATNKTQYLFRINKGREELDESINEYMPEEERPIPFYNIVYIGDGMTDVPCMTVTKKSGGHAVAVHRKGGHKAFNVCKELLKAERIDYFAPADYGAGKILEKRVRLLLDLKVARINHKQETFRCRREASR
ncbi:MAG: HAD family hydrolase [Fibrobacterota bacterium]